MRSPQTLILTLALTCLAAGSLDAAVQSSSWPDGGGDGLLAATLPAEETADDLSVTPGRNADLFLAWTQSGGTLLRVQRLRDDGAAGFGASGVTVRSGAGLDIGPTDSHRDNDARGRFDLFSTSDGGVVVLWTEAGSIGRDLRAQRYNSGGSAQWTPGGVVVMEDLEFNGESARLVADGSDGVYAVATFGSNGTGVLRLAHLRSNGTLALPSPGAPVDTSSNAKSGPTLSLLAGGNVAVCWHHSGDAGLRFQVMASTGPTLAANGVSLTPADEGTPSLLTAGSSIPGYVLVSHVRGTDVRLLLVSAAGTIVRDESAGFGDLVQPPDVIRSTLTLDSLPEGVEIRGIDRDGHAVRFVRRIDGTFAEPHTLLPPSAEGTEASGALAGPLWVTDLGFSTGENPGRVLARRPATTSIGPFELLDPTLGAWLALVPGDATNVRVCGTAAWVFTASVIVESNTPKIVASRSGDEGALNLTGGSGMVVSKVVSKRSTTRPGTMKWLAPDARLAADTDLNGGAAEPDQFRVLVGSEQGSVAELTLASWRGKKSGAWKASVFGGAATGVVKAGSQGRVLKATLKGLALDPADRVAWIRIELDDEARGAAVLLQPKSKGKKAVFKAK